MRRCGFLILSFSALAFFLALTAKCPTAEAAPPDTHLLQNKILVRAVQEAHFSLPEDPKHAKKVLAAALKLVGSAPVAEFIGGPHPISERMTDCDTLHGDLVMPLAISHAHEGD